jgi:hypothetical protein
MDLLQMTSRLPNWHRAHAGEDQKWDREGETAET